MRSPTAASPSSPCRPTTHPPTRTDQPILEQLLESARDLGFLAGGSAASHIAHAEGFARLTPSPALAVDLGSGAGLPGLPLAIHWPASHWILVEANLRRSAFLREAVSALDLGERVEVRSERAEVVGRDAQVRGLVDLVVARGFGAPAVVAECAAPLLCVGGTLIVSEPPEGRVWPAEGLAELGLRARPSAGTYTVFDQRTRCPDRYPRRVGIPTKRPLFRSGHVVFPFRPRRPGSS